MRSKTLRLNGIELALKERETEQMTIVNEEKRRNSKLLFAHHYPLS
jgi:hypothetical protein